MNPNKTAYYTNRELSWLSFNERVLSEAQDKTIPLLERVKFLSITASNLDEFFMVRVASLKDMVHANYKKYDIAGLTATEQLELISKKAHELVENQYTTYRASIISTFKKNGFHLFSAHEKLNSEQQKYVDTYFMKNVYPVLTPMAVDSSRPFPLIRNKSLNIGALIMEKNHARNYDFATVQVPTVLPRLVELPRGKNGEWQAILLEEVIERNIDKLFLNYDVICAHPYRIMRNADLTIEEEDAADLLKEIEKQLKKRQWGEIIRLEVEACIDTRLLKVLKREFGVQTSDIYGIEGPLDLTFLMQLYDLEGMDTFRYKKHKPQLIPDMNMAEDIFTQIRKRDIFLHHPYMTFDPVVEFIKQAATDPEVLAIKQTLYRVSGDSQIIKALEQAAENGKQVSVLVELKARFDEENNIQWARKLEKAGCHVIYGLVGLKTHSKIILVVRREKEGIRRYVHLGTGNYNDVTAKIYTDCGIFTCKKAYGEDATAVFNMLSGFSEPKVWKKLVSAPVWLRNRFLNLIENEMKHATNGKKARIIVKVNSLCDKEIIAALYTAAAAGVKIDLIVRGICCLRVGIEGVSENIKVRSIVGNFLEHSRIFYFYADGEEEIYLSSADWMTRNLDRRVELLFPIEAEEIKKELKNVLEIQLQDTAKAHILQADNTYKKENKQDKEALNSQDYFCKEAKMRARKNGVIPNQKLFIPVIPRKDK